MMTSSKKKTTTQKKSPDDFASVAARLGCDPNLATFDAKLKKIAKGAKKSPR
jgi:hypothetical protein